MAIKAALQEPRIATSLVGFCRPEEVRGAGMHQGLGFSWAPAAWRKCVAQK